MQHMEASAILCSSIERLRRTAVAGLVTTNKRVASNRRILSITLNVQGSITANYLFGLRVNGYEMRALCKKSLYGLSTIHQHIACGGSQKEFNPGDYLWI